ncbi:low temperature requirement protein A [Micromonospora sp. NPDC050795]|uniref:low temperature requirement protein A n=1 Tax=Micromonospora sp. NPDC050795 TaxID=3364282 RepID=UPI0037A4D45C
MPARGGPTLRLGRRCWRCFDVFYVAMFAQLSMQLATKPTWGGLGQSIILLLAAWWTWAGTAIDTEYYDPRLRRA